MAAGEITVHDLVAQTAIVNASANEAAKNIKQQVDAGQEAGTKAVTAQQAAGAAEAIIVGVKETAEAAAKHSAASITASFGANPNAANERFSQLGQEKAAADSDYLSRVDEVARRQNVKFLDDPTEWLYNNIFGGTNDAINAANLSEIKRDTVQKTIEELNRDAQQVAVTASALAETKTAATAQASVDLVKANTDVAAAKITQDNAKFNIQGIQALQAVTESTLRNNLSLFGAENAEKQLGIQAASLALHAKTVEMEQKKFDIALEEKTLTKEAEQKFSDTVNAGRVKLGLAPVTQKEIMLAKKLGGEQAKIYDKQFQYGDQVQSTGSTAIDTSPASATVKVLQMKAPLTNAQAPVVQALQEIVRPVWDKATPAEKKADPTGVVKKADEPIKEYVDKLKSNINTSDPKQNFYAAPDLASIASAVPAVTQTALYQKVLAPLVQGGMIESDPARVSGIALDAVRKGTISINDYTRGMTLIYQAAAATNNVNRRYSDFGVANQDSYKTYVAAPNFALKDTKGWSDPKVKVNWMDPAAVSYYAATVLSSDMAAKNSVGSLFQTNKSARNQELSRETGLSIPDTEELTRRGVTGVTK